MFIIVISTSFGTDLTFELERPELIPNSHRPIHRRRRLLDTGMGAISLPSRLFLFLPHPLSLALFPFLILALAFLLCTPFLPLVSPRLPLFRTLPLLISFPPFPFAKIQLEGRRECCKFLPVSAGEARPQNDFWCILTLQLNGFPLHIGPF